MEALLTDLVLPVIVVSFFLGVVMPIYLYHKQQKELLTVHKKQHQLMQDVRERMCSTMNYNLSVESIKIDNALANAKNDLQAYKEELFEEYTYYEKLHLGILYLNKGRYAHAAKQFILSCNGWQRTGNLINVMFCVNLLLTATPHMSGAGFRFMEKSLKKHDINLDTMFVFLLAEYINKTERKAVSDLKGLIEIKRNQLFTA